MLDLAQEDSLHGHCIGQFNPSKDGQLQINIEHDGQLQINIEMIILR